MFLIMLQQQSNLMKHDETGNGKLLLERFNHFQKKFIWQLKYANVNLSISFQP